MSYSRFSIRVGKKYIVYTYAADITVRMWVSEYGRVHMMINPIGNGPL